MRITRESLIKIARDTAAERLRANRRFICIYLTGSLLGSDPLLGGTTDIDLVMIHDDEPPASREIVRLSEDVHLDIAHYSQARFHQPRNLRLDPWLAPFICHKPMVLHDTAHWFEFTEASIAAEFRDPTYALQRSRSLEEMARQSWLALTSGESVEEHSYPQRLYAYLKALENAGNALASLSGPPLTERRFMLQFPQRCQLIHRPDLSTGLIQLSFNPSLEEETWVSWLPQWKEDYIQSSKQKERPSRLHPACQAYYLRAAIALWKDNPAAACWLLLRTWTLAAAYQPQDSNALTNWNAAIQSCRLDEKSFEQRLEELDLYLDQVEEMLDNWAKANGLEA